MGLGPEAYSQDSVVLFQVFSLLFNYFQLDLVSGF